MKPLLLDRHGDAPAPAGTLCIDNERALLEALLQVLAAAPDDTSASYLIRGAALCAWAEKAWRGRDWACHEWQSPVEALLLVAPLSRDEGARLWEALGATRETLPQPYRAADLLHILHPDFDWHSAPSWQHAAQWLLWRDVNKAVPYEALLESWARGLRIHGESGAETWSALYVVPIGAVRSALRQWLGLEGAMEWSAFPVEPPARWMQEIRKHYATQLTRDGATVWENWRLLALPMAVLETTASATVEFLAHHSAQTTPNLIASLSPFLPPAERARLRALCPPSDPGDVPHNVAEVLSWVTERYLEFRLWQAESGDAAAQARVTAMARAFGEWYLGWYSGALVGIYNRHLATYCAEQLRRSQDSEVVFWVIADGLGWNDAQTVMQHLTQHNARLSVTSAKPVFSPLPTITHFCKKAIRYSTTPLAVAEGNLQQAARREIEVSGHRDAAQVLAECARGDIVIWKPMEPDNTYHEIADRSVAHSNVGGALRGLAGNILAAVDAVPENRALRIVLCTDHGRLLGSSQRRHAVPSGCESHGRAAYRRDDGILPARAYDVAGVCIEGDLAWLEAARFGLPVECVVPLDEGAFLTNSKQGRGHGGIEEFPHGGVFPEEVVIPWIEIERDARRLMLDARITGRARAGMAGRLQIALENPNAVSLRVTELQLNVGGQELAWERADELAPYGTLQFEIEIESWPQGISWRTATARLVLQRLDGHEFPVEPTLDLSSEELQSRDDILGDML